ncbi:hypothetical protein PR202_gb14243 [Eleusine coracana subsp. coracana]|uniref:GDSL esterase/lipase n=1 Tax=Eleusine coracana subsp. coracana TaxID=191504 RepID=A0AAV5EVR4_ELECO|nr:hypothetical protein PR202_gb14243 [Eleusine coracana subsp. coracana]
MMKSLFGGCFILLLLLAHNVESRRHDDDRRRGHDDDDSSYTLFVFGDAAADNGNFPNAGLNQGSRSWYYPYGISDKDNDNLPSGRFSDNMVQSDFLGKILGYDESPPPYAAYKPGRRSNRIDPSGMNFANSSAGVWWVEPRIRDQVVQFRSLIADGAITKRDLEDSVALVAFSGRDYSRISDADTDSSLQDLGVSKVLVNTVPPLGCTPWTTSRFSSYDYCDQRTNRISDVHNKYLTDKLGNKDGVLLLDVNTIVTSLLQSSQFQDHKSRPCCETKDQDGYCGQYAGQTPQFTVCRDPGQYLYWDFLHPTHAGWKAIMQRLQSAIRDFLDI